MSTEADPIVDGWYQHLDKGQRFKVVAVDEGSGIVEVQHFDGDLEEFEMDAWYEMDLQTAEAPENWSGAVDVGEVDDLGTEITDTTDDDWAEPATELDHVVGDTEPETPEEILDDWGDGAMEEELLPPGE